MNVPTCPKHPKAPLFLTANPVGAGDLLYCSIRGCQFCCLAPPSAVKPEQLKLGIDPGKQSHKAHWPEKQTEDEVEKYCASHNIERLVTTVRYKYALYECGCYHRPKGGYGATPGVPDTLLIPDWMPPGLGILCELKGSDTPFSCDNQRRLADQNKIVVARTGEEARYIVERARGMLKPVLDIYKRTGKWPPEGQ